MLEGRENVGKQQRGVTHHHGSTGEDNEQSRHDPSPTNQRIHPERVDANPPKMIGIGLNESEINVPWI